MEKDWYDKEINKIADKNYEEVKIEDKERFLKERKKWFGFLIKSKQWKEKTRKKEGEKVGIPEDDGFSKAP